MSSSVVAGLCRLRFHAPGTAFELAVPADVPLADLLPAVLGHAGPDLAEDGLEHGGWVLQRLGGEPLDEERSAEALGLHDGESLYLRERHKALPPVHFDDLVDGVATGVRGRGDTWRPAATRVLSLALALTAFAAGWAPLAVSGPGAPRAAAAAGVALLLLFGAAGASRAMADAGTGAALGAAAVPYLALAAFLVPQGPTGGDLLGARTLAASSAAAGAAVLALAAVGAATPLFLGVVLTALLGMLAGALLLVGLTPSAVMAVMAVAAVLAGAFVPSTAFRLSGLRLPMLPRNAEELQENIDPVPASAVLPRALVADDYLMAFHTAIGAVCTACLAVLPFVGGWAGPAETAALSLLLLLHARAVGSIRQRLVVLLPGVFGVLLLLAGTVATVSATGRLALAGALPAAGAVLLVVGWTVPGRRLLPYWGRAADILHTLCALSLLPLALQACGVYRTLRGLGG
ncbi:type VII secretion integral membrane protein EccD [Kitasatospora sp. DSM 101779]|uniref:type VII secretion integral membrane protein EccD n=1 Tax=Kitasatospora sp. DSM 101779 TaxID=2853165 RepID=UPI0021D871C9|nr:type VII secretion integral membrane protein EccD [Kitasatospora sp. DSM 101779]MCU7825983.1 type VII secretion integral membrane protein EccD [Kitasatospora sp. DSM 101779]